MKAALYQTPRQVRVKVLPEPRIERPTGVDHAPEADKYGGGESA